MKSKKTIIMFVIYVFCVIFTICFLIYTFHQKDVIANKYHEAQRLLNEGKYNESLIYLEELKNYKDGAELYEQAKQGEVYNYANQLLDAGNYEIAIEKFNDVIDFKDSNKQIKIAKYNLAIQDFDLENYDEAKQLFLELDNYKDSKEYLEEIQLKEVVQLKEEIYNNACALLENKQYEKALKKFKSILEYKDSKKLAKECNLKKLNNILAAGTRYSVAITNQGKVKAVGGNYYNQCEVDNWKNIVSIDGYGCLTIGLKDNGKVKVAGRFDNNRKIDASQWENIVDVAAGERFVVGLQKDGHVIADGHNDDHQINIEKWENIISIDAGWRFTVGLTKDGELKFAGVFGKQEEEFLYKKDEWKDVINISAGGGEPGGKHRGKGHTVGLKLDGTVVAVGDNSWGQCNISKWSNIVKVVAGDWYTVGLRDDGKILITGENRTSTRYIDDKILKRCTNIVDITAGYGQTLCLTKDGTIIAFGFDDDGKCTKTLDWKDLKIP